MSGDAELGPALPHTASDLLSPQRSMNATKRRTGAEAAPEAAPAGARGEKGPGGQRRIPERRSAREPPRAAAEPPTPGSAALPGRCFSSEPAPHPPPGRSEPAALSPGGGPPSISRSAPCARLLSPRQPALRAPLGVTATPSGGP